MRILSCHICRDSFQYVQTCPTSVIQSEVHKQNAGIIMVKVLGLLVVVYLLMLSVAQSNI
jgi:hypothetical protein